MPTHDPYFIGDRMFFWITVLLWAVVLAVAAIGWVTMPKAHAAEGMATYYTVKSCQQEGTSGIYTANGERYDENALTAALPHHQFGGLYRVCRLPSVHHVRGHTRRRVSAVDVGHTVEIPADDCVVVRHNDRGPGRGAVARGVIIDLTPAAYDALGCQRGVTQSGVAWGQCPVTVERINGS